MDLPKKEEPSTVDGSKVKADMLLEVLKLVEEAGVVLAEMVQHLLDGVLLTLPAFQTQPHQHPVTLHRRMQPCHQAVDCVQVVVNHVHPS